MQLDGTGTFYTKEDWTCFAKLEDRFQHYSCTSKAFKALLEQNGVLVKCRVDKMTLHLVVAIFYSK